MLQNVCPITIGVGSEGKIFSDRFQGWYRTSPETLKGVLHGGCYNDNNPSPITSVKLVIAADARKARRDLVLSILKAEGWAWEKVDIKKWDDYPQKPH